MTSVLWASWSDTTLSLSRLPAVNGPRVVATPHRVPADWRYAVRLFAADDGGLLLRSAEADGARLDRVAPDLTLRPLAGLPPRLPPYHVLPQPGGAVLALVDDGLLHWAPGSGPRTVPAPAGFAIRDAVVGDAVVGDDGRLWICGSVPVDHPSTSATKAAFAVTDDLGATWRVRPGLGGGLLAAWRAVMSGAAAQWRWIRVVNGVVVLAALGGPPEDSSTLVTTRDRRGRWHSTTWPHDVFRAAAADGDRVCVYSHRGRRITVSATGRHQRDTIVDPVVAALGPEPDGPPLVEILDVEPRGPAPVVVAGLYRDGPTGRVRCGEAVVRLGHDAATLIARHAPDQPEIVSAISA